MIRLDACRTSRKVFERIASGFPAGSVSGIYDRSLNLEAGEGFLIHIGMDGTPLTPRTATLPGHAFSSVLLPRLRTGQRVFGRDGCVFLPDAGVGLCVRNSPIVETQLHWPACLLPPGEIRRNLIRIMLGIESMNNRGPLRSPLGGYFLARVARLEDLGPKPADSQPWLEGSERISLSMKKNLWAKMDGLLAAITGRTGNHLREIVGSIIGLGPGLTPSGDDFLAGFTSVAVARDMQGEKARSRAQTLAQILLEEAEGRTTSVSAAMFEDASRGEMSEPALLFVSSLLREKNSPHTQTYAMEIASTGAFSGEDFLNGIAAALAIFACPGAALEPWAAGR